MRLGLWLGFRLGVALWLGDGRRLCDGLAFRDADLDGAALPGLGVADAAVSMLRAVLTKNTAPHPPHATTKTTEQITATMPAVVLGFRGGLVAGPLAVLVRCGHPSRRKRNEPDHLTYSARNSHGRIEGMEPMEQCWRCKRMTPVWDMDGCCSACADDIAAQLRQENEARARSIHRQARGGYGGLVVLAVLVVIILIGLVSICR